MPYGVSSAGYVAADDLDDELLWWRYGGARLKMRDYDDR